MPPLRGGRRSARSFGEIRDRVAGQSQEPLTRSISGMRLPPAGKSDGKGHSGRLMTTRRRLAGRVPIPSTLNGHSDIGIRCTTQLLPFPVHYQAGQDTRPSSKRAESDFQTPSKVRQNISANPGAAGGGPRPTTAALAPGGPRRGSKREPAGSRIGFSTLRMQRHQWSSGRIHRCHPCDPGSIPG